MMDIERFDCTNGGTRMPCHGCYTMEKSELGDYVKFEDYEKLLEELESLRQYKARAESQKPVAFQSQHNEYDFTHFSVKELYQNVKNGSLKTAHFNIPLYAHPVPSSSCAAPEGWHEEWEKNVRRLYLCARKHDMSIPDSQLDFMPKSLIAKCEAQS